MNKSESLETIDIEKLSPTPKTMASNIIQWNIQGTKTNLKELMLFKMNFHPSAICTRNIS